MKMDLFLPIDGKRIVASSLCSPVLFFSACPEPVLATCVVLFCVSRACLLNINDFGERRTQASRLVTAGRTAAARARSCPSAAQRRRPRQQARQARQQPPRPPPPLPPPPPLRRRRRRRRGGPRRRMISVTSVPTEVRQAAPSSPGRSIVLYNGVKHTSVAFDLSNRCLCCVVPFRAVLRRFAPFRAVSFVCVSYLFIHDMSSILYIHYVYYY
jgi:hypothetical protein